MSTSRTLRCSRARKAERLMDVIVFPHPPFWFTTAIVRRTHSSQRWCLPSSRPDGNKGARQSKTICWGSSAMAPHRWGSPGASVGACRPGEGRRVTRSYSPQAFTTRLRGRSVGVALDPEDRSDPSACRTGREVDAELSPMNADRIHGRERLLRRQAGRLPDGPRTEAAAPASIEEGFNGVAEHVLVRSPRQEVAPSAYLHARNGGDYSPPRCT